MREVKTEPLGTDRRTFLLDMGAQYRTQCLVQQMRSRMVARGSHPAFPVHHCPERSMEIDPLGQFFDDMDRNVIFLDRSQNLSTMSVLVFEVAGIAHLTTALGVERRHREYQLVKCSLLVSTRRYFAICTSHSSVSYPTNTQPVSSERISQSSTRVAAAPARAFLLRLHLLLEPFHIHRKTGLARQQFSQVQRKSVRVVQLERLLARDDLSLRIGHDLVESRQAFFQVERKESSSSRTTLSISLRPARNSGNESPISRSITSTSRYMNGSRRSRNEYP